MAFKYFFFHPISMAGETSKYLFWLGVLIALIIGVVPFAGAQAATWLEWLILIQVIIGLIVGYLNISAKETGNFFLSSLAFMVGYPVFVDFTKGLTQLAGLWTFIDYFLMGLAALIAPAVLVVACKVLPEIMKD